MKINAGIIGMGIGQKHFDAIEGYKKSQVSVICEKNRSKLNSLKKKYPSKLITNDENKIFKDKKINLVSIASYDNYHFNQIVKGLNNKKNLIVEKPLCLNLSELKKINNLLKKNKNLFITSNLVLRVNSLFKKIKKITKNNNEIFYIEADYIWGRRQKLFQWRSKIKEYSVTLGAGIHMIDLIMWLLKKKPIYVTSYSNDIVTKKTNFKKKSFLVYIFEFPKNVIVKITANAAGIYHHFHEVKIFEKKKTLVNNFLGSFMFSKKGVKTHFKKLDYEYPDKKNRKKIIQNFIDILIDKKINSIISFKDQYNLMKVCFAADRSIILKKKIKIEY